MNPGLLRHWQGVSLIGEDNYPKWAQCRASHGKERQTAAPRSGTTFRLYLSDVDRNSETGSP